MLTSHSHLCGRQKAMQIRFQKNGEKCINFLPKEQVTKSLTVHCNSQFELVQIHTFPVILEWEHGHYLVGY